MKTQAVETLKNLKEAEDGSFYTIRGAGGELSEWVTGLGDMLDEAEIGRPSVWYRTTGAAVNRYANDKHRGLYYKDAFKDDLPILMFPLDGLDRGRLAMFRLTTDDKWFDDMIANMRSGR